MYSISVALFHLSMSCNWAGLACICLTWYIWDFHVVHSAGLFGIKCTVCQRIRTLYNACVFCRDLCKSIELKQVNFNTHYDINMTIIGSMIRSMLNTCTCNWFILHGLVTQINYVSAFSDPMLGLHELFHCNLLTHFCLNHYTLILNMLCVNGTFNYNINIIKYNQQRHKGLSPS